MTGISYNARDAAYRTLMKIENAGAYSGAAVDRVIAAKSGAEDGRAIDVGSGIEDGRANAAKSGAEEGWAIASDNGTEDGRANAAKSGAEEGWAIASDNGTADCRAITATGKDAALLRELVYGVVKWKLTIDHMISIYSKIKISKISPAVMIILRLGLYQIIFLDKIPVSAACNESVKLAKKYSNEGSVRFVNALLRKAARWRTEINERIIETVPIKHRAAVNGKAADGESLSTQEKAIDIWISDVSGVEKTDSLKYLSVRHSFPVWMCERWLKIYGFSLAAQHMTACNSKPELTIRVNTARVRPQALNDMLINDGFCPTPGLYDLNALILSKPSGVLSTKAYSQGCFTVQDESSMLCVRALDPRPGEKILDLCAAPGGKAGYIAELTGGLADINCADVHPHRLDILKHNMERLGHKSIKYALMDCAEPQASLYESMDKVLLDAPCSGLGVIRKKPEIKWNRREGDIVALSKLQKRMIGCAAKYLKRGGVLLYSVCTTEPEECGDVVREFLSDNSEFKPESLAPYLPTAFKDETIGAGYIKIYTNIHYIDGFYIARLVRK